MMITDPRAWEDAIGKVLRVEWFDSHSFGGWRTQDEWRAYIADEHLRCVSFGYLLDAKINHIVLAQSKGSNNQYADCIQIPLAAITDAQIREEPSA